MITLLYCGRYLIELPLYNTSKHGTIQYYITGSEHSKITTMLLNLKFSK